MLVEQVLGEELDGFGSLPAAAIGGLVDRDAELVDLRWEGALGRAGPNVADQAPAGFDRELETPVDETSGAREPAGNLITVRCRAGMLCLAVPGAPGCDDRIHLGRLERA